MIFKGSAVLTVYYHNRACIDKKMYTITNSTKMLKLQNRYLAKHIYIRPIALKYVCTSKATPNR